MKDLIERVLRKYELHYHVIQSNLSQPTPIEVYVTGAVQMPDSIVSLPPGSRALDAITAAGGMTEEAHIEDASDLERLLYHGDEIYVQDSDTAGEEEAPRPKGIVVRVNFATAEELEVLPGIGPELAQRIIQFREEKGAFIGLDHLDKVPGIGPLTLEEIADMVSFDW